MSTVILSLSVVHYSTLSLESIFKHRWRDFSESDLDKVINCLSSILKNADGALWVTDFFDGITDEGTAAYESWIKHVLPECRHDAYNKEKELLEESLLLEDPADSDKYPIHRLLLNTVKKN